MNDKPDSPRLAKTITHGRPTGEIGWADIERRARELALIAGRDEDDIRPEDLHRAEAEMEGRAAPESTAVDAESLGTMSRDPSEPPAFHDGPKPNVFEPNEQDELEHTVLDGVEEAQHDQMVEARKRRDT